MIYRSIDANSYFSPFDRIARLYSINASGLTMREASKIGKYMGTSTEKKMTQKMVGINLSATAPDAFGAMERISILASHADPSHRSPTKKAKKGVELSRTLPSISSPDALRQKHRMLRSKPHYEQTEPRSLQFYDETSKDFDNWNPEGIDDVEADVNLDTDHSRLDRFEAKANSVEHFYKAIDLIVNEGVSTATGSGHRVPVPDLPTSSIEGIITRTPSRPHFLESEYIQRALQQQISEVKKEYRVAAARASVEYLTKDPEEWKELGINPKALMDDTLTDLWMNHEYQLPEWRIYRLTSIDSRSVLSSYHRMDRSLCTVLSIMLELQNLWFDGSLPSVWWENMPSVMKCNYNELLFVDVNQPKFRSKLPLSLDDFTAHIEGFSKDIRDALGEYWLVNAAGKLSNFITSMPEDSKFNDLGKSDLDSVMSDLYPDDHDKDDDGSLSQGSGLFKKFKEKTAKKALTQRMSIEGVNTKTPGKRGSAVSTMHNPNATTNQTSGRRKPNKAEKVVDCAVTLMSRQLRGMCENSLVNFSNLFEKLSLPVTSAYSIFIINVRLRKRRSKEITTDFSEAVEVCLQPDLEEFKGAMNNCINNIVNTSRGYSRPEQALGTNNNSFGGKNHHLLTDMLVNSRHKKMNESSVSITDEIVYDIKDRILEQLERFYVAPNSLLKKFDILNQLFSGEKTDTVMKSIRDCIHSENIQDSLEALGNVSKDLENLIDSIKHAIPDVSYYPMFEVRCFDLKELLVRQCRFLLAQIMDAVVEENRNNMMLISQKYSEIANTLIGEITDSAELRALQEFTNRSAAALMQLHEQYVGICFERIRFLLAHKHKFSRDDIQTLYTTYNWPSSIQNYLRRSYETQSTRKKELEELLEEDQRRLENDVNDLLKRVEVLADNGAPMEFRKNVDRINAIKRDIESKQEKADEISERETLLEMPHSDFQPRLDDIKANIEPLERLWITIKQFVEETHHWHETRLSDIDPEHAERTADEIYRTLVKVGKEFDRMGEKRQVAKRIAESLQSEVKEFMNESVPLMLLICNPGMKERHWNDIEAVTGLRIPRGEVYTMNMMLELGLQHHTKAIEDICVSASKEYGLQLAMEKMETEWKNMNFETKEYRTTGTRILTGIDEIQQLLDDQIVKTQAMKASRFIKPFLEQITKWEETLTTMQDILDNWLKVQSTWLYLEPIFSSEDIMRQMPAEGKMFKAVDNTWRVSMAQTFSEPSCIKVARRAGFLESLIEANAKLEQIQKGLNDYLETKRLAFPRFFFLSNDELLEILAETKDPLRVQPHLKKCFDGIAKLQFQPNLDITACFDPKDEKLDFPYEKVNHKKINPNDSGGNVERWLIEVEVMMKKSLAYTIDFSMKDYLQSDRLEWLRRWQGQVIIAVNQIRWCVDVERTISQGISGPGLDAYYKHLCDELMRTVELVRGDIPKQLRVAIGALVVMDVHNRDTIAELVDTKITSINDFDWQCQLRYYWNSDGESAKTGKPATVVCRMINAMALYAYEYIGNQDRLVITPLTDRCYRTLMGAIHLNLGGAPEGPAGTGKTETTKDLAKAIAIQCVVTNCSDGLDYLAMAKFFKGLASSGAWACFDEFNRIQLEVLSVVAQQIMQIQLAKIKQMERFVFEGTELELKPTCCPFITMNPGYAGRAELPDNLKVLFRTVAMMVPDYAMISEIILYSYGYTTARPLSVKIVTTYKLCSEQLSSQSHYDYGMRAVIAVLRAAGNLKRSDGHLPEDVLVLRSIIDVNLPKFLSPDVPLFNGIVSDLFPGVKIDPPDRNAMKKAFEDACEKKGLIAVDYFWDKVVQIYDMMVVRHGFMIVGMPYSGKSSAWKILGDVLGLLHERFPKDKRWSKVLPILQNPKSITMGQLYGQFDAVSHEWTDGVLAINYRNAASNRVGNPEDRKWILFDGPVDALWIENMNTVLDDNKKLCLMSGEIIAMTDVMSMMFEPMDLLVASPATVSRCGMIYMEPEKLGWKPLLTAWLQTNWKDGTFFKSAHESNEIKFILHRADVTHIQALFDWLVEPSLAYIRKECHEMSPTVDSNLVMSLLNILESLLPRAFAKYKNEQGVDEELTDAKRLKQRTQDIECCFFFAVMWSIGKSGTNESQSKFSTFLENYFGSVECIETNYPGVWNILQMREWKTPDFITAPIFKGNFILPMPMKVDYYECVYVPEDSKWKYWTDMIGSFVIPADTQYSNIVVPNNYTAQYNYMIELLVPERKHILMCGPTGTGKSVYVFNAITKSLPQDRFKPLNLGFSAKTSANMTQDIIDGKLDKRRKGVYGPPQGCQSVVFIDDLNMPEVETYGAQPPIELIRQLIDNGGWYDLKDKSWKSIIDTSVIAAMGPAGGGRNSVTPRLLRHFNLFCFSDFDDTTLRRIFSTIVQWHFSSFPPDIRSMSEAVVDSTLDTYRAAMKSLLPTPQKSHYTFNLRDFSRIIQGVLLCKSSETFTKSTLIRLWTHEALRVFGDRLINDADRLWFHKHVESMCQTRFNATFYDVFKHLDKENKKSISVNDLRALMFGDYLSSDDPKPYNEIRDASELQAKMEEYLNDYNQQSRKPMDLVMFGFAIEHISRISRILKMPGGNALLVGVGGSGRQSVTRLAAFMAGYTVFQIEISKNYTNVEWREDLKTILKGAGAGAVPMTFLFSDTQIKNETFVEDINNMLNNGEVPNIFPADERNAVCEAVRPFARQVYGKASADMTLQELYAFFIRRVKQNLHIVLAFSPIGEAFRDRLRKFPALINCCTIDWFTAWPSDALIAVAERFLATVKFDSDKTRSSIVTICQKFHQDVIALSDDYLQNLKRRNYVTPTSYLELIVAFKQNLDLKRTEVSQAKRRYEIGLDKLAFAADQVNKMQKELEDLQPELVKSASATEELMAQIEQKMPGVMETRKVVSAEAAVAQKEADLVQTQKNEVEADLAEAIPALEEAIAALNTIKPNDINEIKALAKPPEKIRMVCKAVCIMLDIKPVRIPDPADPTKRIMDYWGPSQRMLSDSGFINSLMNYDKDNMNPKIVAEIKRDFIDNPDFVPEIIAKASKAAEGMCRWIFAMVTYDRVAKVVAPKKAALEAAESQLNATLSALNVKKAALQKVEDDLKALEDQLAAAKRKKVDLENQADSCDKKIVRANQLLDGLGGERDRWSQFASQLAVRYEKLTGDVLVSSGLLAYLGPFTAVYRQKQMGNWVSLMKEFSIPCSDSPTLTGTLGDAVKIRQWNIDGLPTDSFSIDNGIIVFNARRWPLMIDPQGQANKWIRNMEKANNLQVIKLTDGNYLRSLENSIQFGSPVLLENVGEELDPSLEPLLLKQLFKQGGVNCIRLGDATVEYSDQFRFYITTKLRNPHYLPEISVKVTLLNFMITPEGLQDQLLGIVVSQERPDLEEQRNILIIESAENKRQLKEIEDRILHIMSSSSGNILEDETAIQTLKDSKTLSDEIKKKQAIAEETELNINNVRLSYSPIAYSSQILFFCIADLANIEPVYQYSLTWFINLFITSINKSEKGRDVTKRLENLNDHFNYSLYRNVCRSLLEKDKLLFSFLLTSRIMNGKGLINQDLWLFLLTGGIGTLENKNRNPAPEWLAAKSWDEICKLSDISIFKSYKEEFASNAGDYKKIYDSLNPQDEFFPGSFADFSGLERLCLLRTVRPDKLILAIQDFVSKMMGDKFIKPPPFDLQACYADSSAIVPLVFILSAGSDPMGAVFRAGEQLKTTVDPISLGQGQGPKAEKLIQRARQKGTWVVLQNCHLAPSWMTTLEKICEDLDPDDTHPGFRLWCTTYPSDVFPVTVLQNGVKMTNEPPKGLRANLLGSFNSDPIANEEYFNHFANQLNNPSAKEKHFQFHRLIFGLCFFHANVQERRLYGPLGWNIPYEFNESDLRISLQQLKLFLDENEFVPFKALIYTAGECNYGGRVTDDKDRRTLLCILKRFYNPLILQEEYKFSPSGVFQVPKEDGNHGFYLEYIDQLPLIASPEIFGLHDNATLTKDQNDTNLLLNSILDTESSSTSSASSSDDKKDGEKKEEKKMTKEDTISSTANDIFNKLPANFDMEYAQLKYPVLWEESMNTVLCQELIRFNNLLSLMKSSLENIQKAVKGLVVMSSELEVLGNALFVNRIPLLWKSRSYPSLKPLAGYISDQQERLKFFSDWLMEKPPTVFWISGFFFTQAFLTGAAQNYARKYTIPIDDVVFDFDMKDEDSFPSQPKDGVYTYGLFLEGARWEKSTHLLAESQPKVLFTLAPIMHWVPYRKADIPQYPHYKCPVYKTSDRR
jgi:dynein heavy chain